MTTDTPQEVKRNFLRVQDEIETLVASHRSSPGEPTCPDVASTPLRY